MLALVTSTDALIQVTTDGSGASTVAVFGIAKKVRELVWSPDGSQLAISDGVSIYTVAAGGSDAVVRFTGLAGDDLRDVGWSPDLTSLVFRTSRGGKAWFELLDIASGTSVVLTPAAPAGELSSYRRAMSLSPIWTVDDELLIALFHVDTPGINLLDISGALE